MSDEESEEENYRYSDDDIESGSENEEVVGGGGGGGGNGGGRGKGSTSDDGNLIRILSEEGIKEQINLKVNEVAQLLSISEEDALILCNSERWCSTDSLVEKWFQNTEKVAEKAGIKPFASEASNEEYLSSLESFSCPVCADEKKGTDGYCLSCRHVICKECWTSGLSTYVDSIESLRTTCFDSCDMVVPRSAFEAFLSPENYQKYERWLRKKFVECSSKLRYCPKPQCNAVALSKYDPSDSYLEVQCSCKEAWCFGCSADDHRPASCSQVKAWNSKSNDTDLTAMYIKANSKACPQCNLMIVKDEGCAHMKCSQCSFHFCWLCLGPYSAHNEKTGGFYACNKFEKRVATEGRTDEERKALSAARALKNYEMSFERHLNHQGALDAAIKDLTTQVELKAHRLTDKLLESDLHQLRQAVSQVVSSRRVLAWSYVFKFYQFEDDTLERELQLFETYQGKLESMTEELQSKLSDMSGLDTKAASFSSSGLSHEEETHAWVQSVIHLCGAVKNFSTNVVHFADNMDCYNDGVGWEMRDRDKEAAEGGGSDKEKVVWAWRDDNGSWTPFSDANIKLLEDAHNAGDDQVIITGAGRRYKIDIKGKRQTNMETMGSRLIRRQMNSKETSWTCAVCSYHNHGTAATNICTMCEQPRH